MISERFLMGKLGKNLLFIVMITEFKLKRTFAEAEGS
jgi:hypothetical protein